MKIFDCFTFFNEVELLELRLKLLSPYVDYFILVEANVTHRGKIKPLVYKLNEDKFLKYKNQIIYVNLNLDVRNTHPNDWYIENLQRDSILRGLEKCNDNDLVIVSDLDEIPNPLILKQIKENNLQIKKNLLKCHRVYRKRNLKLTAYYNYFLLLKKQFQNASVLDILNITPLALLQNHYYYYVNYLHPDKWCGSVISLYKNMKTPQSLRDLRRRLPVIKDGGWHFAYMGGYDRILKKVNSTVDENSNRNVNKIYTEEYIKKCLDNGSLIYDYQNQDKNIFSKVSLDSIGIPNIDKFIVKYPKFYLK